jgi:hypothetical protein
MSLILSGTDGLSDVDGTAGTPAIRGTDANTGIFFPAADTIAFTEDGTEAMRLDSSGNMGIGTTSPTSQLSISQGSGGNNLNVRSRAYFGGTHSSDSLVLGYSVKADPATTDRMIGTETNSGGGAPAAILMNSGVMQFHTATSVTSGAAFSSERMRITSGGALCVGTTSNTGTVRFIVESDTTTLNPMSVSNTRATAATDYSIIFYRAGNIVGSVQTTLSATSFVTSSDYRLKENIAPMTGALAKVALLKPVTYDWKTGGSSQGFIAHELQEVIPEAVAGEKDAVNEDGSIKAQGIDTSFLVATLTAAIQELKATVDAQAARIAALESK